MKLSITFYYLIFLSIIIVNSCAFNPGTSINTSIIDNEISTAIKDSIFPGAVLLFGQNDQVLYHKAFGNYTYEKNSTAVKKTSIFDLASVSKVVATTSAAMILYDRKELFLDDKVIKYLSEFDNNEKAKISIRNLLLHNSGLPAFKKYYDEFSSAEEVVNDIMHIGLLHAPGEKYIYSDLGMIALQKVIEKITEMSLDEFLNKNLFNYLEMHHTMYNPSNEIKNKCVPTELDDFWRMRLLQGEVHDERAYLLNGVAGHAGLFSTAKDLSNFVLMLLNEGMYGNEQIIKSKTIDLWTTKQSDQSDRGLGWDTKSVNGYSSAGKMFSKNSFGHTGYTGTSIWVDKDSKLFVILLTNRVHPKRTNRKIVKFRPKLHDIIYKTVVN